jgi:hypothetical protein
MSSSKKYAREVITIQFRNAKSAAEAARRSRARSAELRELGKAGAMVITGLLMAVTFCLLTHRI